MIYSFFKEIHIIGKENLPKKGPVILCGTHNSQYVDGMMLILTSKRPVNFLIAEKSTRHKLLKYFLKFMNVVPVTRAIDLKKSGKGKISLVNTKSLLLKGQDTQFSDQINPNDTLRVTIKVENRPLPYVFYFRVMEIVDQSTLKIKISEEDMISLNESKSLKKLNENEIELNAEYYILPKIDQKQVFKGTLDALNAQKVIGIFPEGGSHDQTKLIEIKPGACIFQYKYFEATGIKCPVIPVGLNYFGSHKFRSKVVINIGAPIKSDLREEDRSKMSGKKNFFIS
jgi:glycerol-3-phosphate O-acyltransferase/dihydroxyacetone phosphate acyltransferase